MPNVKYLTFENLDKMVPKKSDPIKLL